jgi:hypothetical protein
MSSLQLASDGVLPLCVIGLATNGYIACDQEIKAGGGKRRKVFRRDEFPYWLENEEEILQEIRKVETKSERQIDDAVVDYSTPSVVSGSPLIDPKPLDYFTDPIDRELAIRLRIIEIRRHSLIQCLYAEELRRLEEELAILLFMV